MWSIVWQVDEPGTHTRTLTKGELIAVPSVPWSTTTVTTFAAAARIDEFVHHGARVERAADVGIGDAGGRDTAGALHLRCRLFGGCVLQGRQRRARGRSQEQDGCGPGQAGQGFHAVSPIDVASRPSCASRMDRPTESCGKPPVAATRVPGSGQYCSRRTVFLPCMPVALQCRRAR